MRKMLKVLAAIFAAVVMAIPMVACGDSSKTQSELDLLKETIEELTDRLDELTTENGELTDRLDDLTTENGELTDKIDALNVFTTDKAEYNERETITIFYKKKPFLKIRINFDSTFGTALYGLDLGVGFYITSLYSAIYAESITNTVFIEWNNGICISELSSDLSIMEQNKECRSGADFIGTKKAYDEATWFDLVICAPGTPFELARFKNVSHTK